MSKLGYFIGGMAVGIAGVAALACADDIKRAVTEWIGPRKDETGGAEERGGEDDSARDENSASAWP
ncbi:MAG: hypothetical protein IKS68_06965 [Mailhella sp.]|nr:hypothetical protein [Mailhella sp.]